MQEKTMRKISERVVALRFKEPTEDKVFIARTKTVDGGMDYEVHVAPLVALGWSITVERNDEGVLCGWTAVRGNIPSQVPAVVNKPVTTKTIFPRAALKGTN